ncbi:MAG: carboxymuconolactone decarboxylase family protein [Ornithinimicrobium sp.]
MTAPTTLRIRAASLDGPLGRLLCRLTTRFLGQVPDTAYVLWHHRPLTLTSLAFEGAVSRWSALDEHLKTYAVLASAAQIGCSWCLDFGYYGAHVQGLDVAKVSQVPRWRTSDAFSELERNVMDYAEAMTATPPEVTDEQVARLESALGSKALVELTMMVAVENERSRVNAAMGLRGQGFSDTCPVPLADSDQVQTPISAGA